MPLYVLCHELSLTSLDDFADAIQKALKLEKLGQKPAKALDNRRLQEVGFEYLDDLVNLGFFDKVAKDRTDIHYLIHDLMHDLAQDVSSKDCFTTDGSQLQSLPSTIRHLSIITTAQYSEFEKNISAAPPPWLGEASTLIHLQSIYLEDCKHLRTLPPFVHLKCLKKLHLSRICGTAEVLTHSLEELVINEVDDLQRWAISDELFLLASELQVLEIKGCPKLNDHPLSCYLSAQIVFPLLHHFIIHDCPLLMPLPPLPLGPKVLRITIVNVGSLSNESLSYYQFKSLPYYKTLILDGKDKLRTPDGVLTLQNLGALSEVSFISCSNLTWFSWVEAFRQLKLLKKLNFEDCSNLLSVPAAQEDQDYRNSHQFPCVENLAIESCCIRGNQLAHLLSLLPSLSCLELEDCPRAEDDECMLLIPPGPLTSSKEICIENCVNLSCGSSEALRQLISLEKLKISFKFISSLMPDEMEEEGHSLGQSILLPSSLQELPHLFEEPEITDSPDLETLDLHSCTELEEIGLHQCGALSSVRGLHTCIHLRSIEVFDSLLFCKNGTSVKLEIIYCPCILSLQEQCLPASLEELVIESCENLLSLPDEMHHLSSLNKLEIKSCPGIKSLPESGLPPALREFWVWDCSEEIKKRGTIWDDVSCEFVIPGCGQAWLC
uniref:NB-ARC domain-containing protein n=1 Tax=Oryza punctata TaxID=4537 RepID=A0A0E0LS27_ORYPU